MEYGYFFTGFPGFISNQLIREVLRKNEGNGKVHVLVLPNMFDQANTERAAIIQEFNLSESQFEIIKGDITASGLAIDPEVQAQLKTDVTHIFHLAAIYDLAVPKYISYRWNVDGTRNVNDWARSLKNIQRYTYFSTAFVAGKREGILYENEIINPPGFKNF